MSGYRWDPVFRVVAHNGGEYVYWLSDRLTDVGGHTRIVLRYVESMAVREDINRSLRPVVYGLRPEVEIECVIWSMEDQIVLSEIESALLDPRGYSVFLSLVGGVIERQVVLAAVSNAEPISGKTVVGATFRLAVRCVDLIPTKPNMMTDPAVGAELVQDGGMEQWVSGSDLQAWTIGASVATLAQETTIVASGASSAKFTRNDSGTFGTLAPKTNAGTLRLERGRWYRYRGKARGTSDIADTGAGGPFRATIINQTRNIQVSVDGRTWVTSPTLGIATGGVLAASFTSFENHFRIPLDWPATDIIFCRHSGYWTSGQSLYYDDISVYGPALRPGVATW